MDANANIDMNTMGNGPGSEVDSQVSDDRPKGLIGLVAGFSLWLLSVLGVRTTEHRVYLDTLVKNDSFLNRLYSEAAYYSQCASKLVQGGKAATQARAAGGAYRPRRHELCSWVHDLSENLNIVASNAHMNAKFHSAWASAFARGRVIRWVFSSRTSSGFGLVYYSHLRLHLASVSRSYGLTAP